MNTLSCDPVDDIGLMVIGAGASVSIIISRRNDGSTGAGGFVTMAIILLISFLTQLLINKVNRPKSLALANENLEIKVKKRTAELRDPKTNTAPSSKTREQQPSLLKTTCRFHWQIRNLSKFAVCERKKSRVQILTEFIDPKPP